MTFDMRIFGKRRTKQHRLKVLGRTFTATLVGWMGTSSIAMLQCSDGKVRYLDGNLLTKDGEPVLKGDKANVSKMDV